MLPTKSNQSRSNVARNFLRVTFLSSLTSCMFSGQLQAQSPNETNSLIRQPAPRSSEMIQLPASIDPATGNTTTPIEVPAHRTTDPTISGNLLDRTVTVAASPTVPNPLQITSAERVPKLEPTSAIQSVAYRSTTVMISALEAPPGWTAVEKSIREKLETCDAMLRRGAIFSARQTCWKGLEELCQVIDLHSPQGKHVESLRRALVAMREEEDFYRYSNIQLAKPEVLANLCFAHETPVIRSLIDQNSEQPTTFNPLIAAQHYRSYARDQLVLACDHHPWAADLLYALGKALEKQAWEDRSRSALVHQHAELVYQAALETNPSQTLAATQLGYVLLQLDRPQEARDILARSLQSGPTAASLQNLAEACRRLNDQPGVQWCATQLPHAQQRQQGAAADIPFTEINPRQFAAISPPDATFAQGNPTGIPNITAPQGTGQRIATQASQQSNPESNGTNGWIPSLWR